MIHSTPRQDDIIAHATYPTIRSAYQSFETTFVFFHPFLKINPGFKIAFETNNWPTKKEIISCTENITWADIIQRAGLQDNSELDRLLAYLHCARRIADREGWIKLMTLVDQNNFICAQVDILPETLINPLMSAIRTLGYSTVQEFDQMGDLRKLHTIDGILLNENWDFVSYARVQTPDNKLVIDTEFDARFSYLSGSKEMVKFIIEQANLEGFYCTETTRSGWSHKEQTENVIDWDSAERNKRQTKLS